MSLNSTVVEPVTIGVRVNQCAVLSDEVALCLVSWLSVLSYFNHMKIWSKDVCCNVLIYSRSFVW
ncbi:hypothetical protein GIB67_014742 [Kingdonia uniflora]|uniref:Uncharacterized protein n=1 Tax=Kingdonia uniflora TaxID=39325 RepID=A0A7J7NUN9_9MAGN|nr:hypothetical protein GIB67_014742 [Kingdonia uniflora]